MLTAPKWWLMLKLLLLDLTQVLEKWVEVTKLHFLPLSDRKSQSSVFCCHCTCKIRRVLLYFKTICCQIIVLRLFDSGIKQCDSSVSESPGPLMKLDGWGPPQSFSSVNLGWGLRASLSSGTSAIRPSRNSKLLWPIVLSLY